jgi:biopolymer transport protein TolQ
MVDGQGFHKLWNGAPALRRPRRSAYMLVGGRPAARRLSNEGDSFMKSADIAQSVLRHLLRLACAALLVGFPIAAAWAQSTELAPPAGVAPLTSSDLSIWGLFWSAHPVVKIVMVGLLVASIWVWAIVIDKTLLYMRTKKAMDRFEQTFWSGQSLEELYRTQSARPAHSMAALFVAAMREWKRSFEGTSRAIGGLQMRIEKVMDVTIAREIERLERRLLVLATVGSAGPFIGLFGTVWGIMTSFQSIAASKNTSLAVVAPGIAEALFATAIGLVAAIPATIFYNKFVSEVNKQAGRLEGFADEFAAILSRQIDEAA